MLASSNSTPLLLIPGLLCNADLFGPQIKFLSPSRQVIVGDVTGSDSIEALAQQVLDKAPRRFALAGLSMGGIVSFEILRQAPERVEKLALLDTNPGAEAQKHRVSRLDSMRRVEAGGLETLDHLITHGFFPYYVASDRLGDAGLRQSVRDMVLHCGVDVFLRQSTALLNRTDSWDSLSQIQCPTLVLCGDQDKMCRPDVHVAMADKIHGSQLEIIADCGHLSTLEKPDDVNRALLHWLDC